MTPVILLVLSILTIHFRQQLFALLSFSDMSLFGKESFMEVFLPSLVDDLERISDTINSMIIQQKNILFIKILDRDYEICQVLSNSLEYPKSSDGFSYLTD